MKQLLSTNTIETRWTDLDMYQHVNHERYFDYMTEARQAMLHEILPDAEVAFFLVDVSCQFKKALDYPQLITLRQYLTHVGNRCFQLLYEFVNPDDVLCAEGTAVIVCVDRQQHRSTRLPIALQQFFAQPAMPQKHQALWDRHNCQHINTFPLPTRWCDVDANGYVNDAFYFAAMTEARIALARDNPKAKDHLFFVVNARAVFHQPLHYPNEVRFEQYLYQQSRTSMTFVGQFFTQEQPASCFADAMATIVFVDKEKLRPCLIPEGMLDNPRNGS